MLNELAKNDDKWRQIALMITNGNKFEADDIVNEMYLRRYDNDRGQPVTDYYILLTMKSIYLNQKKTNKLLIVEDLNTEHLDKEHYQIDDSDKIILDRYLNLNYSERELLELSYDHSLRDIQKEFGINYGYAYKIIKQAREKVLQGRINEYNNKRLKHKKMKSTGLGDTIEKITKATGIKTLIDKMNIDCGCDERKEYLNKVFKYKLKPRCFTDNELQEYAEFIRNRRFKKDKNNKPSGEFNTIDVNYVINTYNSIFSNNIQAPDCRSCSGAAKLIIDLTEKLDTVYLNNIPKQKQTRRTSKQMADDLSKEIKETKNPKFKEVKEVG